MLAVWGTNSKILHPVGQVEAHMKKVGHVYKTTDKAFKPIKTKNLSVEKERSIDSKAQKNTNKITKFRINAFL